MLSATYKSFMLSVVVLNVVMLSVIKLSGALRGSGSGLAWER
jgi:hypothetical protein